jgi:hypothetical protein
MKKVYNLLILSMLLVLSSSCEKELTSEGVSKTTYYADMKMAGEQELFLPLNSPFTDPGVTATEKGNPIPVSETVTGIYHPYSGTTIDMSAANKYEISYTATNSDGFSANVTRTVYVAKTGDLVNSIEGLYTSTVKRNGVSGAQYTNMKYI